MTRTLYFKLFIALCSLSECTQHRYHYINIRKTWTEAQRYCREKYTDLATVNNMKDMEQLMKIVNNNYVDVWIGLQNTGVYKWKWALGDPVIYQNWENGQSTVQNNCAFMRNGTWRHHDCYGQLSFICYNESSKGYIYETFKKTWRGAQSFCRQKHTDLASVLNPTINQQIEKIINDSQKSVWIGLFSDLWEWSDKSDSTFRNWKSGEPNGGNKPQCSEVKMTKHGQWNDRDCRSSCTFVCHENKLVLIKQNLSWPEALRYCRENHMDLVSVNSEKIQHWVTEVVKQASTAEVWLGLRHSWIVAVWFWVSGEIVCYQKWAPGNGPAQENFDTLVRSGAVKSGGEQLWISLHESHKLNFICIKEN